MSALLIIAVPYYWFLADAGAGPGANDVRPQPVTIDMLRRMATTGNGQSPVELRVETVGLRLTSRNMLVAGSGLRQLPNVVRAYELIVPGAAPLIIDRGISRAAAAEHGFASFDTQAQARVGAAIARATHVIELSDRPSHNGGHATGTRRVKDAFLASGGAPYTLAPGVVVIPARGLAPGTAMVYVRLSDDHEYLFTGDVAPLHRSWHDLRLPARLATRSEARTFRESNLSWLMTINALHRAAPRMTIVTGHEPSEIPFSAGTFSD
ncbi:MBL fold metallo-hydrolase [Novosphingobium gossypii]|uniref:hypothetical protein n=1 Tax=Novosphingobium gossypii TaxID=1604774 RepID=UPI003D2395ED